MYCDLHVHSTASDGSDRPEDLPGLARRAGLEAIALTDHDTTAGLAACAAAAEREGLAFVPGIELSADPKKVREEVEGSLHILGLFIDGQDRRLGRVVEGLQENRRTRARRIIERLNELGVRIRFQEVLAVAGVGAEGREQAQITGSVVPGAGRAEAGWEGDGIKGWPAGVVGRPHVAMVLVRKGYAKSIHDAFARYLARGAPAYVPKSQLTPEEAIRVIHEAGGLAILAHPVQLQCADEDEREYVIKALAEMGLDGIETQHWEHAPADVERFETLARRLHLLTSGGSDYHGANHAAVLGGQKVDMAVYERLGEAWQARRAERIRVSQRYKG